MLGHFFALFGCYLRMPITIPSFCHSRPSVKRHAVCTEKFKIKLQFYIIFTLLWLLFILTIHIQKCIISDGLWYSITCCTLITSTVISLDSFYLKLVSVVDFSTRHGCPRDVRRWAPCGVTHKKGGASFRNIQHSWNHNNNWLFWNMSNSTWADIWRSFNKSCFKIS